MHLLNTGAAQRLSMKCVRVPSDLLLEILVQTIFAGPLDAVANESWRPSAKQVAYASLCKSDLEASAYAIISLAINLHVALDHIQGCNTGVCRTCVMPKNSMKFSGLAHAPYSNV